MNTRPICVKLAKNKDTKMKSTSETWMKTSTCKFDARTFGQPSSGGEFADMKAFIQYQKAYVDIRVCKQVNRFIYQLKRKSEHPAHVCQSRYKDDSDIMLSLVYNNFHELSRPSECHWLYSRFKRNGPHD